MDPLTVNASLGIVLASASAGAWFLNSEIQEARGKYASAEARLNEAEKIFTQLKAEERNCRKKQSRQASLSHLEDKMKKAEKTLLAVKARA